MSDNGQPPSGMSASDLFNMNSARRAAQAGGDGGGGVMGVLGRFFGINWEQPQGFAEIMSADFFNKNVPAILDSMLSARSWVGSWLDDIISRLSLQSGVHDNSGFEQVSAPPVEGGGGGGAEIDTGGGGISISAPMFESAGVDDIAPPQMPQDSGAAQSHSAAVDM